MNHHHPFDHFGTLELSSRQHPLSTEHGPIQNSAQIPFVFYCLLFSLILLFAYCLIVYLLLIGCLFLTFVFFVERIGISFS